MNPILSTRFLTRQPSAIRAAQIRHAARTDGVDAVNTAIGNVSLPTHPAMQRRMFALSDPSSPFAGGVVQYTPTVGFQETNDAFLNSIAACGLDTTGLYSQITNGGSHAMEIAILGVAGDAGSSEHPILMIDATYTNYPAYCGRLGRRGVSVVRSLHDDGRFELPEPLEIERVIKREKPSAILVIPYDNPTGHFYSHELMTSVASLCVKHGMWLISDEAYRGLVYIPDTPISSVWALSERDVPGITGRRISIETASKIWNACGIRIGALITDNEEFHRRAVAEGTTDLCASAIGQYIFGALAHEPQEKIAQWYDELRAYYSGMMIRFADELRSRLPGVIVSRPDASIYAVVDVRSIAKPGFNAGDFVAWCAGEGSVSVDGRALTLLTAPMRGFYADEKDNPGVTQMRIAFVESPERISLVPYLFTELFRSYEAERSIER